MPTTLEILRAEREAQDAEEARPPFGSVDALRTFIADENPALIDNVALEMCWLGAKEYDKFFRAELINRDDEQDFATVVEEFRALDPARRSKCVFILTIWKNFDGDLNRIDYRPGFSYRFDKVHSLKLNCGKPVGSMQIRERLRAAPLPPLRSLVGNEPQQVNDTSAFEQTTTSVMEQASESSPSQTPDELTWASPPAKTPSQKSSTVSGRNTGEAKSLASTNGSAPRGSPAAKTPKRKASARCGDDKAPPLESPMKRTRGREPKELFPASEQN
ncbi:hypothetical protein V7S43_011828 [Phytophthora oleae]|uniref:Uncharacterized protein n=1 Tax=Phytophthora oleae TaxID=2107226 RepID=A0ABD3F979_9STRA